MRELQRLFPDPAVAQMLAAEDLAARCLEAGPLRPGEPTLRPQLAGRVAVCFHSRARGDPAPRRHALRRMRAGVASQLLPPDVSLTFLPPGKELERFFLSLPAGASCPAGGWPSR